MVTVGDVGGGRRKLSSKDFCCDLGSFTSEFFYLWVFLVTWGDMGGVAADFGGDVIFGPSLRDRPKTTGPENLKKFEPTLLVTGP